MQQKDLSVEVFQQTIFSVSKLILVLFELITSVSQPLTLTVPKDKFKIIFEIIR